MKKLFLFFTWIGIASAFGEKPNIVYILADDMGYGDVHVLNPECKFPTPHLDRMAGDGMIFTDAHTGSSCCTPTRYGILTGRYAWRTSLKSGVLSGYSDLMIDKGRTTVASFLKKQGYMTACIGKWHMGINWPTVDGKQVISRATGPNIDYTSDITGGPLDVGFDYFFGLAGSLGMPPHGFIENRRLIGELGEITKRKSKQQGDPFYQCRPGQTTRGFNVYQVLRMITERAVDYIGETAKQQKPFFLYFALNSPHAPVAPHSDWAGKSGINPYADFVMETDWSVGHIFQAYPIWLNGLRGSRLDRCATSRSARPTCWQLWLNCTEKSWPIPKAKTVFPFIRRSKVGESTIQDVKELYTTLPTDILPSDAASGN